MNLDWKVVLGELTKNSELHPQFLNTISLMEYMGARKIVKSQLEKNIDTDVLAHMTEEIRHAQIFKKMALKLSDGRLKTYSDEHLLAGPEGRAYIQSVDQSVAAALKGQDAYSNYLLSTLLIEERANEVYPYYAELMEPLGFSSHLKSILREEESHLEQIKNQLKNFSKISPQELQALRMIEQQAFDFLIQSVAIQLGFNAGWEESETIHQELV